MQSTRPSRKRAGTVTNGIPQDPARRIRLDPFSESGRDDKDSKVNTWLHSHSTSSNTTVTSSTPIPIPIRDDHPTKYITPPTPCSSPEPRGHPSCQAGLDWFGYPINVQHNRPGYSPAHQRNEFPFPIQPLPKQLQKVRLELTIPEEPEPAEFDVDIQVPNSKSRDKADRPPVHPLPTPPRSHPSVPTCFSYSPPSSSYEAATPSSTAPSSGLSSLSSSVAYSPTSPKTPNTPLSRFNSAANALKLVLMANDIGMSLQELEELNEFAAAPMSGSSKRGGRVLVRKDIQQRREKDTCRYGGQGQGQGQGLFHLRDECVSENCGKHTAPGLWRDITWSRFSDTTDEDVSMSGVNVDLGGDGNGDGCGDTEMAVLEGYIKIAVNADADNDGDIKRSSSIVSRPVLATAEVGRRVRPAELCMRTSGERVDAAVGPMGERMWS